MKDWNDKRYTRITKGHGDVQYRKDYKMTFIGKQTERGTQIIEEIQRKT